MPKGYSNKQEAWKYFYPEGEGKAKKGYCLHHIDSSLRENDSARYYEWRIEDLQMMTLSEHNVIHKSGNEYFKGRRHCEAAIEKNRQAHLGKIYSEETCLKHKEAMIGRKWINDGIRSYRINENDQIPEGFSYGRGKLNRHRQ